MGFKKFRSWFSLILILVTVLAASIPATSVSADSGKIERYIITFQEDTDENEAEFEEEAEGFAQRNGGEHKGLPFIDGAVISVPAHAAASLRSLRGVATVEADGLVYAI